MLNTRIHKPSVLHCSFLGASSRGLHELPTKLQKSCNFSFKKSVPFVLPLHLMQATRPRSKFAANLLGTFPVEAALSIEHPLGEQLAKGVR